MCESWARKVFSLSGGLRITNFQVFLYFSVCDLVKALIFITFNHCHVSYHGQLVSRWYYIICYLCSSSNVGRKRPTGRTFSPEIYMGDETLVAHWQGNIT